MANADLDTALDRLDRLRRQAISCPACQSPQVQLIDYFGPAAWKCRRCKHKFTSEPTGART